MVRFLIHNKATAKLYENLASDKLALRPDSIRPLFPLKFAVSCDYVA